MAVEFPKAPLGNPLGALGGVTQHPSSSTSTPSPSRQGTPALVPRQHTPTTTPTVRFPDHFVRNVSSSPESMSSAYVREHEDPSAPLPSRSPIPLSPSSNVSPGTVDVPHFKHPFAPPSVRRVRSEAGHRPSRPRVGSSLLAKRPSQVTGGYETSDDSDGSGNDPAGSQDGSAATNPVAHPPWPKVNIPGSQSYFSRPMSSSSRREEDRRPGSWSSHAPPEEGGKRRGHSRPRQSSRDIISTESPTTLHSPHIHSNGASPPASAQGDHADTNGSAKPPEFKGKGRSNALAASLGLDSSSAGDASLSPGECTGYHKP